MMTHVPLEYRYALDAVSSSCWCSGRPLVVSNFPALEQELVLRRLTGPIPSLTSFALWIEPTDLSVYDDLSLISSHLCSDGVVNVILSQPLSRLLPEVRRSGFGELGATISGTRVIMNKLQRAGFRIESSYGIHGIRSVGLNALSRLAEFVGRDDLSDRLLARARAAYCTSSHDRWLSTVMLITARKSTTTMISRST